MSGVNDFNFVNRVNKQKVEPDILPGETAIEYMQRTEKEKMAKMEQAIPKYQQPHPPQTPQQDPPVQEVVFYEGYKLPRNFLTCITLCIMKLDDPEVNKILETFGFEIKDLNGKPIVLDTKKRPARKKKAKKRK